MARGKKQNNEINAGSMADIAFLLLIFFLVTTTIKIDKGILHRLPPWIEEPQDIPPINKRNVLEVLINANDLLLVENEYVKVRNLREVTKRFISNNGANPDLSDSPEKAVVSLKNDRGTSYDIYLQVQNELKAAYRELRDDMAKKETRGRMTYEDLRQCENPLNPITTASQKKNCETIREKVKNTYPMKISEAEPEDLGEN
ncbi:MAG: biopolymer transporter ExbD [Chitinophagales bacterium]|nr:biopolymer transporter ExbD [Chitinophagales bacterium]